MQLLVTYTKEYEIVRPLIYVTIESFEQIFFILFRYEIETINFAQEVKQFFLLPFDSWKSDS